MEGAFAGCLLSSCLDLQVFDFAVELELVPLEAVDAESKLGIGGVHFLELGEEILVNADCIGGHLFFVVAAEVLFLLDGNAEQLALLLELTGDFLNLALALLLCLDQPFLKLGSGLSNGRPHLLLQLLPKSPAFCQGATQLILLIMEGLDLVSQRQLAPGHILNPLPGLQQLLLQPCQLADNLLQLLPGEGLPVLELRLALPEHDLQPGHFLFLLANPEYFLPQLLLESPLPAIQSLDGLLKGGLLPVQVLLGYPVPLEVRGKGGGFELELG